LDAADMGVVEADPAELDRYRAKQRQNHNRYIQKRRAMQKNGQRQNLQLLPGTPTWIGDDDWDELTQTTFLGCALLRVPQLATAHAFVVQDVAAPPRLMALAASLGGGLVASVALIARPPGPIIRYEKGWCIFMHDQPSVQAPGSWRPMANNFEIQAKRALENNPGLEIIRHEVDCDRVAGQSPEPSAGAILRK